MQVCVVGSSEDRGASPDTKDKFTHFGCTYQPQRPNHIPGNFPVTETDSKGCQCNRDVAAQQECVKGPRPPPKT